MWCEEVSHSFIDTSVSVIYLCLGGSKPAASQVGRVSPAFSLVFCFFLRNHLLSNPINESSARERQRPPSPSLCTVAYWVKTWNSAPNKLKLHDSWEFRENFRLHWTNISDYKHKLHIYEKKCRELEINFYWIWNVVTVYSTKSGAVETSNYLY